MRILIPAYEGEGWPLSQAAKELQDEGNRVKVLQADLTCVTTSPKIVERYNYESRALVETLEGPYKSFLDKKRLNQSPDWKYLQYFEENYCLKKNLLQIGMTDPILFEHHHDRRPYYCGKVSKEDRFLLMEEMIRWVENWFLFFDPHYLIMLNQNYFVKNVASIVAPKLGVEVKTFVSGRIEDIEGRGNLWFLTTKNNNGSRDLSLERAILSGEGMGGLEKAKAVQSKLVKSGYNRGLYQACSPNLSANPVPLLDSLKTVFHRYFKSLKQAIKIKGKVGWYCKPFASDPLRVALFATRVGWNRIVYRLRAPFYNYIPEKPYFLFPLHTLPESSTLTFSKEYFEADLIRFISKEIPVTMRVAVLENPNMLGIRRWEFYKEIEDLPNVVIVDPKVETRSLLSQSAGVVGISGTALLEGVLMGKPAHCFGDPPFREVMNSSGYEKFSEFANKCFKNEEKANETRALRYMQYVIENGEPMNMRHFLKPSRNNLFNTATKFKDLLKKNLKL